MIKYIKNKDIKELIKEVNSYLKNDIIKYEEKDYYRSGVFYTDNEIEILDGNDEYDGYSSTIEINKLKKNKNGEYVWKIWEEEISDQFYGKNKKSYRWGFWRLPEKARYE